MTKLVDRIRSIDAFRAVTMFLMIFVNDLDGIPGTPEWLKHAGINDDALGLADTIFPAFLFIVGLSIPYAFENRIRKDDAKIPLRILTRTFALVFIGFFHANMETYDEANAVLPRPVWDSLATFSFFFIFIDYSKSTSLIKRYISQGLGIALLIAVCAVYKSNDPGHPWLHLTWWGILGLIGWAYGVCAFIYYYSNGVLWVQAAAWLFFMFFNIDVHFGLLNFLAPVQKYVWLSGNGAMQAFTMAGIFVSVLYIRLNKTGELKLLWVGMFLISVILFNLGFIVRYFSGGISKLRDTPSWTLICTGISLVIYAVFVLIVDVGKKYNLFKIIEPAGTSTFTCYLLPFLFYPLYQMTDFNYPQYMDQGTGGLIRSLLFAFVVVQLAGLLERVNVKLKI
ncbi:DUF5009 domain-containing protein [Mucilaginibacter terrenus]|uniref:DUF5009 domain-containing protein n=1 Tax=Mucilaginibacter terrenus TaxID=2482727 RepID=A0A3E2NPF7_9SPHI|nr:DUF5009 domain-containing protein [Mucilaginibacter terrenus]RFZ82867.1 DUF5009 domain-containing protein [Mucilaginibacter terrenus]